ncbi:MAG TPA: tetratricopeptide repeat protein, partial [Kofleriaceae bacterium]|nr:tetratricopeptide repeat protein [Kofleriaceae bacterium]
MLRNVATIARARRTRRLAVLAASAVALGAAPAAAAPGAPGSISSAGPAPADRITALDALGADDVHEVERAVAAIAAAPARQADPDVLFAAARACEDRLLDPARAVAIYARIVADHPGARVATAASRRIAALSELIGPAGHPGQSAALAAELAQLVARADAEPAASVLLRGERLAGTAWPGAPAAALWLGDWLRRSGRLVEAQAHYARVVASWPASPQARAALRGGAGCALEAHDWSLAAALAHRLPAAGPAARTDDP